MTTTIQLSSRSNHMLTRLRTGGIPLVTIPGGEIWTHPRHGVVRIAKADAIPARMGKRVAPVAMTRLAASIGAARMKAAGMCGRSWSRLVELSR